jgi:FkbM family methyltransferase
MADISSLQRALKEKGFRQALNIVEFYNAFPGVFPDHYWLTDKTAYRAFGAALDRLDSILADETSRHWLEAVIRFRLSGDYDLLPEPRFGDQYRPHDLPPWQNPLRFIDCGAFDGDTLHHLAEGGYEFESIAAFEPDPENFRQLAQASGHYGNAVCFPCALGSKTEILRFNADSGMSSHLSSTGAQSIQCVTLDEALPSFAPNLIKMDIEGAELEALRGAHRMITKYRPGLAISLYHTPGHLWQIPLLLHDWNLGYRFYIRGHAHNSFELVLYALPAESTA